MIGRRSFFKWLGGGAALPVVDSVRSMKLSEGDIIVISSEHAMSQETCDRIRDIIQAKLPGHKCLVLTEGLKIEVLRK